MMIKYESKISKVLSILKFVMTLPAIVFAILYWVKNNELFLTLVFACTASFFLCDGSANLIEIPHCLRKEEKKALKMLGIGSLIACGIFVIVLLSRVV